LQRVSGIPLSYLFKRVLKGGGMTTVRHLLLQKAGDVWSVTPDTSLQDALNIMYDHDIGVVVVMDKEKIRGILSERDFARRAAREHGCNLDSPVKSLMTSEVYFVHPDELIEDCMAIMTEKHIRHLPVLDKDKLVGLISIGDLVREVVSQKDITIQSLENYILGREFS
jgi:CBS domain-containing protein